MRLTLRTLLAWLDDKLPPAEVREIGKQVSESSYAKELVERIHRVTRQRRLTVPPSTGPEATDPNLVASYIDNEMDTELVPAFEKKCLTSDVHLAEVSSTHQILSLIGQRAKVPTEARFRMYSLVKGREALRPKRDAAHAAQEVESVTSPIQPWVTPAPPPRPFLQRFGPVAAVVGLILVLGASAWSTLTHREDPKNFPNVLDELPTAKVANNPAPPPQEFMAKAEAGDAAAEQAKAAAVAANEAPAVPEAPGPADAARADLPAWAVASAKAPDGVLLRFNSDLREWVRVTEPTPFRENDRVLSLEPFRSTLAVGDAGVDLVSETEVGLGATPKSQAARVKLARGKVVLHSPPSGHPFSVQAGPLDVTVTAPAGSAVGVERLNKRSPGGEPPTAPSLAVYVLEGPVKVASGSETVTIESAGAVTVGPDGKVSEPVEKAAPNWVAETSPSPFDQKVGEQFLQFLKSERPVLTSLVEASEDEQKDVCRLAIPALKAVGDISLVVPPLNRKGSPTAAVARRTAIAVLRSFLAEGPESAKALSDQLRRDLGDDLAATTEKLLAGYTEKEARDDTTYAHLVALLGSADDNEVGVRELALDNLRQLTGRDDLEYDPEKPEGPGLKAWRDLLRDKELKPAATGNKAPKPAAAKSEPVDAAGGTARDRSATPRGGSAR